MNTRKGFVHYRNIGLSIFGVLFGAYFFITAVFNPMNGFPEKAELVETAGEVTMVKGGKYGVKFKLNDGPVLDYPSKANSHNTVQRALKNAGSETVKVLIKQNDINKNHVTGQKFSTVYQVFVGNTQVRTYEQVKSAWVSDNKVGLFLGPFLFFAGIYIYRKAQKGIYDV